MSLISRQGPPAKIHPPSVTPESWKRGRIRADSALYDIFHPKIIFWNFLLFKFRRKWPQVPPVGLDLEFNYFKFSMESRRSRFRADSADYNIFHRIVIFWIFELFKFRWKWPKVPPVGLDLKLNRFKFFNGFFHFFFVFWRVKKKNCSIITFSFRWGGLPPFLSKAPPPTAAVALSSTPRIFPRKTVFHPIFFFNPFFYLRTHPLRCSLEIQFNFN